MNHSQDYFSQLYQASDDPWQYESRWYEVRKRAIALAVLPKASYASAIEIGCSNGVLSRELANRCQRLLCLDGAAQAVALARARLSDLPHVTLRQAVIPQALADLQGQTFDLIVLSEVLYYLSPNALAQVIAWLTDSLSEDGTLLLCHWRYPIAGFELTGDAVHDCLTAAFNSQPPWYRSSHLTEDDFLLDVWQKTPVSVAQREGLLNGEGQLNSEDQSNG